MQEIYQRLLRFTHDAVYMYRFDDGKILMANQGLVDVLDMDCEPSGLVGKYLRDVLVYTEKEGVLRREIEKNGEVHGYEYHFQTLKGREKWVIHDSFLSADPVTGDRVVEAIAKDITDRKLSERALSEERNRLYVTLRSIGDAVITTDMNGKVVEINRVAEELTGWRRTEAAGQDLQQVFRIINERTRQPCKNPVSLVLKLGKRVGLANDTLLVARDGTECVIADSAAPILTANGEPLGVVLVFRDVSEKKRIQDALKRISEAALEFVQLPPGKGSHTLICEHLKALVGDALVIVSSFDPERGTMQAKDVLGIDDVLMSKVNETTGADLADIVSGKIHGGERARLLQGTLFEAKGGVHDLFRGTVPKAVCAEVARLTGIDRIYRVGFRKGGNLYGSATVAPVGDTIIDSDIIQTFVSQVSIVLERRDAEEEIRRLNEELENRVKDRTSELESANSELESFAYSVSHDLRAPLRSIDGFSLALLEDYHDKLDDDGKDYLRRVRASAQKMGGLIDGLLLLSRTSRIQLRLQDVDLSKLAKEIAKELSESDPERKVEWRIAPRLKLQGDPQLLRILLRNLLGNAWKFTARRRRAVIEFSSLRGPEAGKVRRRGERVYCVRDNGVGFRMKYASKLFAPFQRLHGEKDFPGVGIGLATVQRIVRRHGGRVWAEGRVNRGAAMYFAMPRRHRNIEPELDI